MEKQHIEFACTRKIKSFLFYLNLKFHYSVIIYLSKKNKVKPRIFVLTESKLRVLRQK